MILQTLRSCHGSSY